MHKRPNPKTLFRILLVAIIAFATFELNGVEAFSNDLSGEPVHENITREALSFLKPSILDDIDGEHYQADTAYAAFSEYHFDGCEFFASTQKINELLSEAITSLNPNSPDLGNAPDAFGLLLHPVQDFYAHSNWVELGMPGLIDTSNGFWNELQPYELIGRTFVIQGEEIPNGISLSRSGAIVRVVVSAPRTEPAGSYLGLITGTFGPDACPDRIAMGHDRLNKDDSSRPNHAAARARAVLQTTHEWCRLVNLVSQQYGPTGKEFLFSNWVEDVYRANAVCATGVDVSLIIDATGSMSQNDPQGIRKQAAKAFIDSASPGDRISVVAFSGSASTLAFMRTITSDKDKTELKGAVDKISNSGSTNINAALDAGFYNLQSTSDSNPKVAILLTDGEHNVGAYREASHTQYKDRGWPVYTIGLGAEIDEGLLGRIATDTIGTYTALTDPTQLQVLYFEVAQRVTGGLIIARNDFTMVQGESRRETVTIPILASGATFFTAWPGSDVTTVLISPSGQRITSDSGSSAIYHSKGTTYQLFKLRDAEAGVWSIELFGNELAPGGELVQIRVAVSNLNRIYLPLVTR